MEDVTGRRVEPRIVPLVVGQPVEDATQVLRAAEFKVSTVDFPCGTEPPRIVIWQEPGPLAGSRRTRARLLVTAPGTGECAYHPVDFGTPMK